jgi:hypothetical protein
MIRIDPTQTNAQTNNQRPKTQRGRRRKTTTATAKNPRRPPCSLERGRANTSNWLVITLLLQWATKATPRRSQSPPSSHCRHWQLFNFWLLRILWGRCVELLLWVCALWWCCCCVCVIIRRCEICCVWITASSSDNYFSLLLSLKNRRQDFYDSYAVR